MNYLGSKLSLIGFIDETIEQLLIGNNDTRETETMTFADLFAGTGIVGNYYKGKGYKVISNDLQYYSYVMNSHTLKNNKKLEFSKLDSVIPNVNELKVIEYLNNLPGIEGFVYNNYCLGGTQGTENERLYFSDSNGKRCDAIRLKIEGWYNLELISTKEYYALISALINSIDKNANTTAMYVSFLKSLKSVAQKDMVLRPYGWVEGRNLDHEVHNEDANILIKNIKGDILYLDPPYNHRQYASNYHVLETIAKYDNPIVKGKTGMRDYDSQKSTYCSKVKALESFEELIKNAKFKYIILSYNDEGIIQLEDIKRILSEKGKYELYEKDYKRFKSDKSRQHKQSATVEYLHCVTCY